jgi:hypothetical protein
MPDRLQLFLGGCLGALDLSSKTGVLGPLVDILAGY